MFLREFIRGIVKEEIPNFDRLVQALKLDPKATYILAVEDEDTARNLVGELKRTIDIQNGPKIVVLAAKGVKLIEVTREG